MTITSSIKRDYLINLAKKGKRTDGRKFNEYREINIEPDYISNAEGSAKVEIGNTQVVAGIKIDLGEPYPDTPNEGVMTTAAELIPLASPNFEPGPPREDAVELARVVDRGIRESNVIDFEKLCIEPGEKIWIVFIDLHILDYDGNLFDACSLAALAALYKSTVPVEKFDELEGENFPLPMKEPPISCTSIKFDDAVVMDASLDEEDIAEARLTVSTDKNGDIRAMQKGLNGSFTVDEIKKVIKDSIDNGKKLRKILYKSVGK
ncbi:MAG: exosome complex protein Rrp42 [Candidatus Thermoplasmatota archaeon]